MGKVGLEKLKHKFSGKSAEIEIHFTTKSRTFRVEKLPAEMGAYLRAKKMEAGGGITTWADIVANSYDEALERASILFDEFCSATVTEEQVIGYKLALNFVYDTTDRDKWRFKETGLTHNVGVEYEILWRIKIGDEYFLSKKCYEETVKNDNQDCGLVSERYNHGLNQIYRRIPYTQENHDFFVRVTSSIDELAKMVDQFFGKKTETLLDSMKNKTLTLERR